MGKITVHYGCGNSVALPIDSPMSAVEVLNAAREPLGYGAWVELARNGVMLHNTLDTINDGDDLQVWDRQTQMA